MAKTIKNMQQKFIKEKRKKRILKGDKGDVDMMETVKTVKINPTKNKKKKKRIDGFDKMVNKSLSIDGSGKQRQLRKKRVSAVIKNAQKEKSKKQLVNKLKSRVLPKKSDQRFESMLQQIKSFVEDGNDVPQGHVLHSWLLGQRKLHDSGTLFQSRLDALNQLTAAGFYWFQSTFDRETFFNTCTSKVKDQRWCVEHQNLANKGFLPPTAVKRLVALGVSVNQNTTELDNLDISL